MFLGAGWAHGRRGVAIVLHRRHKSGFKAFHATSERACALDVNVHGFKIRAISLYMPDSAYADTEVLCTYAQLEKLHAKAKKPTEGDA